MQDLDHQPYQSDSQAPNLRIGDAKLGVLGMSGLLGRLGIWGVLGLLGFRVV